MTLEQLRIFIAVANDQHIRKASEKLNLTQSAVSAAIKALEERYQTKLFDRVGRSIVLNPVGFQFLVEAEKIVSSVKAGEAVLTDLSGLKTGEVHIMASRTVGAYWLPTRLVKFHSLHPAIKLFIRMGNSDDVSEAVTSGVADIGIIESPRDVAGVSCRAIAQDEMVVVVGVGHPWANSSSEIGSLSESSWVLREPGSGTRTAFENMLRDLGTPRTGIRVDMELPDNEAILGVIKSGLGATLISKHVAASGLDHGTLALANILPIRRGYYLLRNEQRYKSKASDAFEALMLDG